jgi:hypothetical protein
VTRDELRNQLWPADTFVDFDHSINAAIRRLREALSDEAENPRFIETRTHPRSTELSRSHCGVPGMPTRRECSATGSALPCCPREEVSAPEDASGQ